MVEARRTQNSRPWEERPVMGLKSNKNFITANAVEVILQGNTFPASYLLSHLDLDFKAPFFTL